MASIRSVRRCFSLAAFVATVLVCLTTAKAMPAAGSQQNGMPGRDTSQANCTVPADLHARFLRIRSNDLDTSLRSLNNTESWSATASSSNVQIWFIREDPNESKTCPTTLSGDGPLTARSLCPYYFDVLQLPDGYFPRFLRYARCKCQRCVQSQAYGCQEVMTMMTVLKPARCSPQGFQVYEEHVVNIATACLCASG